MLPFGGRHIFSNYSFLVFHCTGNASKRSGLGFGFFTRLENQLQAVSPISEFTPYSQMMCACAMARSKNVIIIIISITVLINIIVTNIITIITTTIIIISTVSTMESSTKWVAHQSFHFILTFSDFDVSPGNITSLK